MPYFLILLLVFTVVGCKDDRPENDTKSIVETEAPVASDKTEVTDDPKEERIPVVKANTKYPSKWDSEFKQWTKVYLAGHTHELLKAQCYQESLLDPTAVSHVGAEGLCQFMPFTWEEVSAVLDFPDGASAFVPELAIEAAAYYDARLRGQWSAPRPEYDRMNLTLSSYNAGLGNLLKAQKACGGKNLYPEIIDCLPEITGRHSKETITYVKRIRKFEKKMVVLGE